ncbi:MAG TPA: hypothetical protein VK524_16245 [Polyangiaceae bacterium]|nr:hypothetical protein [Polyangiaceae bacterium]
MSHGAAPPKSILDYGHPDHGGGAPPTTPADIAAFAQFAGAAAARYHGVIWEVWNEPNLPMFWPNPDPAAYVRLFAAAAQAIRARDPSATIVGPAIGGDTTDWTYLYGTFNAGLLQLADAVSVHPYGVGDPAGYQQFYAMIRSVMQYYGPIRPLMATEWGFTSLGNEAQQADLLVRGIDAHRAAAVDVAVIYTWRDDGSDPQYPAQFLGLLRDDGSQKPAFSAVRARLGGSGGGGSGGGGGTCLPAGTQCNASRLCNIDTCGNLTNCHVDYGACGHCPLTCEEGGLHAGVGLHECGGPYGCNNCDDEGVRYCTVHVPFGDACRHISPPYCFRPQ